MNQTRKLLLVWTLAVAALCAVAGRCDAAGQVYVDLVCVPERMANQPTVVTMRVINGDLYITQFGVCRSL